MLRSLTTLSKFRNVSRICLSQFSTEELFQHDLGFKSTYSEEQTHKILATVNKFSQNELKNFEISAARIKRLLQRREKMGDFKAVEDLLELDGFGIKVLEKFCNSVLRSNINPAENDGNVNELHKNAEELMDEGATESVNKSQFATPTVIEAVRMSLRTVVSFHIDLNYFAWTKFNYNRNADDGLDASKFIVDGWECFEIGNKDKKFRLSDLIELLVNLNEKIPEADIYVIEALPPAVQARQPGSALQVNLNIQKTQLVAMLSVLMASRQSMNKLLLTKTSEDGNENCVKDAPKTYFESVFFVKNFLPSRFYKILIGQERVASSAIIDKIIDYNHRGLDSKFDPSLSSIYIPEEYRYRWKQSSRVYQDYLGNSMLTGLTFLKLCVHRCSKSISSLNRKPKAV